jgi:hypothetical protein
MLVRKLELHVLRRSRDILRVIISRRLQSNGHVSGVKLIKISCRIPMRKNGELEDREGDVTITFRLILVL